MRWLIPIRPWRAALLALVVALAIVVLVMPQLAQGPAPLPPQVADARALTTSTPTAATTATTATNPTTPSTAVPAATDQPTARPTARPTVEPTATPAAMTPPRVGLQIGHWRSNELPDELSQLRGNTGAAAGGYTETEINMAIGERVAALLTAQGFVVDLLPATVPPGYRADAFVALHADGAPSTAANGFKVATPWRTSRAAQQLMESLVAEYGAATALPQDGAITFNMRGYYAFSRRFRHAIDRTTPAVIIEMGFLTNPSDRALLTGKPDLVASGIASGITRYLTERDPTDQAALQPPSYVIQRARDEAGADIRAAPDPNAPLLLHVGPDARLMPFDRKNGWYQVVVRGSWRVVGWVREEQLRASNESFPTN